MESVVHFIFIFQSRQGFQWPLFQSSDRRATWSGFPSSSHQKWKCRIVTPHILSISWSDFPKRKGETEAMMDSGAECLEFDLSKADSRDSVSAFGSHLTESEFGGVASPACISVYSSVWSRAVLSLRFLSRENSVNEEQNFHRVTNHVNSQLTITIISLSLERKLFTLPLLCIRNLWTYYLVL